MDRITKSLVHEFAKEQSLDSLPDDKLFEHFCAYLVTSRHQSDSVSTNDICVGAGGDCGIDSIAIIANGVLVSEVDEVRELVDTNKYLDVTFLFVQAERSTSFDSAKIGQFGFGVRDVFAEAPTLVQNDDVKEKVQVINEVFDHANLFRAGNPRCLLYYITTGRWLDDQNLNARRGSVKSDLDDTNLFRSVEFHCLGAVDIQQLDRESKNAISAKILFTERTVLPELPGVEQAYIGVLPATEFLKLIETDSHEVAGSVFYDNVRHWQEWNAVNTEIRETLEDAAKRPLFALLNNGITVVAKRVVATGNRFVVEDYQIVNGCQTSFVLHQVRDSIDADTHVPLRLIATQDVDIRNAIIKATNRQTQIADEQLFALSDFPKELENFFPTFEGKKQLFYERRSKQYNADRDVEKVRVIDLRALVRAFAAMFLDIPHRTTRNYKALIRRIGSDIFNKDHKLEPYYAAAYTHYRLEFLFRKQVLSSDLKVARYHLLMAFRHLAASSNLPIMNSREMQRFCDETLLPVLWDDDRSADLFGRAAEIITDVACGNMGRDNIRTEAFTARVLEEIGGRDAAEQDDAADRPSADR